MVIFKSMIDWIKRFISSPWETLKSSYRTFEIFEERLDRHHTFMLASGIAFNILLYLLPLFLILVVLVRIFFGEQGIIQIFHDIMLEFLPPTSDTYNLIETITKEIEVLVGYSSLFGIIGAVSLLWLSSLLISSFRNALNAIFNLKSRHIFILYRFKDMLLIIVLTVLILIYSYAFPFISFLIEAASDISPEFFTGFVKEVLTLLVSLSTSFLLIYFIFRWVPNERIPRKPRIFSTISTVFMIELSRHIFAWYLSSVSNYGKFYGTYAVIVSIALWVYYSSLIILLSAELGKFIYDMKWKDKDVEKDEFVDKLPI